MTPKLARFLAEAAAPGPGRRPTPFLALDLDAVEANLGALLAAFPGARAYYAVKANPAPAVLGRLAAAGCAFDAASLEEVRACLAAGAAPGAVSFGNTIKKEAAIAEAHALGVRLFAFDSEEEMLKLSRAAPGARVYCRLLVANAGAEWPLSRKFGCEPGMAEDLLARAGALGLVAHGLSFHVGSQQTRPGAWAAAVARAGEVAARLAARGVRLAALNLGGGYPVRYRKEVQGIEGVAAEVREALARAYPGAPPEIMLEPGRFLVAAAGAVQTEVVLVSRKAEGERTRWVYLDIGRFGGMAETEGEAIRYRITPAPPADPAAPEGPVVLAGPTCDSTDTLYEKADYRLPLALAAGSRLDIHGAGAYVTSYASQGFNGFRPLDEHYL